MKPNQPLAVTLQRVGGWCSQRHQAAVAATGKAPMRVVTDEFICSLPDSLSGMARIAKDRRVSIAKQREETLHRVRRRFDTLEAHYSSLEEEPVDEQLSPAFLEYLRGVVADHAVVVSEPSRPWQNPSAQAR